MIREVLNKIRLSLFTGACPAIEELSPVKG